MSLCLQEKGFFFLLCFQTEFSSINSPSPVCECYCVGIPNICGHLSGGRKSELMPSCYLQMEILQRKRAAVGLVTWMNYNLWSVALRNLFLYLFPSCWDGRSCQQKPPWYRPTLNSLAKSWPTSTSIRKSYNRLWRYRGPLLFLQYWTALHLPIPTCCVCVCVFTECSGARWRERGAEEGGGAAARRHRGAVDTARVAGGAALHRPHLHRPASGVQLLQHCSGQGCSQRWDGSSDIGSESPEQGMTGTGAEGGWRKEWRARELGKGLFFILESGAMKTLEEKLDALICALSLNGLKRWDENLGNQRKRGHSIQGQKPQGLPGELMQTWIEGGVLPRGARTN